jgi:3-hydroxyisobutyrate dehydrogenase-like beta-hydroxyacid dehydrogenase
VAARAADAAGHGVLLSMLADDEAVSGVLAEGALEALPHGGIHVNLATVSVALARRLVEAHRQRGVEYVAAPVFGRPDMAAAGQLHIVVAGAPAAVQRVQPLLEAMSQKVWPMGEDPVRATVVKVAGNFMLATAIESMGEACALTRAHGIGAADFLDIMTSTLFAAPVYQGYGAMIAAERYSPAGFSMALGFKDVGLALAAGDAARVPLPFAGVLREAMLEALAAGDGEMDWSGLARIAARRAHLDSG